MDIVLQDINIEYSRGNGQVSDVTGSADVMGRYLAKAIRVDAVVMGS